MMRLHSTARWSEAQKRAVWIGGLALAAGGVAMLAFTKNARAQTLNTGSSGSSGAGGSSTPLPPLPAPAGASTEATVTPISQLSVTGPNGCTWTTPTSAPNDVYAFAGGIANGQGPIPWQEGMSYGPVQMSDGNYWRYNMATGITNPQAPIHDILAQVCR